MVGVSLLATVLSDGEHANVLPTRNRSANERRLPDVPTPTKYLQQVPRVIRGVRRN